MPLDARRRGNPRVDRGVELVRVQHLAYELAYRTIPVGDRVGGDFMTQEVKMRQTMEDAWTKAHTDGSIVPVRATADAFELGWNAALASVELPEGRFEVGQVVEVEDKYGTWNQCVVTIVGSNGKPAYGKVRPLPKTVELTDDEKLRAIEDAMPDSPLESARKVSRELLKGKTLDELCAQYNVKTTREVV